MTPDDSDLGEKALSTVAEIGISSQLDEVEKLDVTIHTDPGKALQGKVDSVEIKGKGMVMKQDLRIDTLWVDTDKVSINPLQALFGNIELTQPTTANVNLELTEIDINRAFQSDFILTKLQNLNIDVNGTPTVVDVQQVKVHLSGDGKFVVSAVLQLRESGETKQISATTVPSIQDNGYQISLDVLSAEAEGFSVELILAFFAQLTNLLDLRNFETPGMSLRIHRLDAQQEKLAIHTTTVIDQIPSD